MVSAEAHMKLYKVLRIILLGIILAAGMGAIGDTMSVDAASIPSTLQFLPVARTLTQPVLLTHAGDGSGRLFIVKQPEKARILKNASLMPTSFLNISGQVPDFTGTIGEQGLLGLAFDPGYADNGYFYIAYTTDTDDPVFRYALTLARYHVSSGNPDLADASSGAVLLSIPKKE